MTRLSEALKRAEEKSDAFPVALREDRPAGPWQLSNADAPPAPPVPPAPRAVERPIVSAEPAATVPPASLIAHVIEAERKKMVVGEEADGSLVEQYRHLAAALHKAQAQLGYRSVMVTSALQSEGKTLTASNLALTLSNSYQRRVLLIDADLRRPRLREMFMLPDGAGLTDSLTLPRGGKLPIHQISPTLWVLTAGRPTTDPMSTLVSSSMKQLLEDAREAFDWVIVDTPPIAILPDANVLAAMIDTALLVVSAQATPYPMVQRAAQAIGATRILGVVLNRADEVALNDGYTYYSTYTPNGQPQASRGRWTNWFRKPRRVRDVQ
jgi:capsular exopolysaccharide synthesis family protein